MKTIAVLLFALASATCVAADKPDCVSSCRTRLLDRAEQDCARWREELPRPDLYNHCTVGYKEGREASCAEFCSSSPNESRLDSLRLDACAEFRGRPPSERVTACNEGYVQARTRAKNFVVSYGPNDSSKSPGQSQQQKDDDEQKRKLTIKSQTSAKNVLEAAREEAVAAFQEAKATEL